MTTHIVHTFNGWDLFLLSLCFLSGIIGFVRGVTREISSLGGWFGAILGAIYFFPWAQDPVNKIIDSPLFADIVAGGGLFFLFLVFFLLLGDSISSFIKRSILGGLDRTLGLGFGLLRGGILICLGYIFLVFFMPEATHPAFIVTAKSTSLIKQGAIILKNLVPGYLRDSAALKGISDISVFDAGRVTKDLSTVRPTSLPFP